MLHAAVASRLITPSAPGMALQGHWCENNRSTGVLAPLELRAIVLGSDRDRPLAAIVTIDAIGIARDTTAQIRDAVRAASGITPQAVIIACSHTHGAPATLTGIGLQPDDGFVRTIHAATVESVVEASGRLEPVSLALGSGVAKFNVNRRPRSGSIAIAPNFGAPVDHRVRVLRIDRSGERMHPLAVLFHYACHPTTKSGSEGLISPDYPGLARRDIESQLGCAALFLQGCCGNVRPLILNDRGEFTSATTAQLDRCARELAWATIHAVERATPITQQSLAIAQRDVAFGFASPRSRVELEAMSREQTPIARDVTAPWARRLLQRIESGAVPADSETALMQAMRIGPLTLVTIPGEPVFEIGQAIEALKPDVWPVGYANDMLGYFCTAEQHREGGYEPTAYPFFDRPAPFADEQRVIVRCAAELLDELERAARVVAE